MTDSRTPRSLRWLWWLGVPVVSVLLAWAALSVLMPPAQVRAIVSRQLARSLSRDVRFADASLSPWPPVRLRVANLEVAEPGGFANGTAFAAKAVDLDLDILPLLSHRMRVNDLKLHEPVLHLMLRADGTTNFDSLGTGPNKPGKRAGAPMDLVLRQFQIQGGRVLVDDMRAGRRRSFAIETRTDLSIERGGERVATSGETKLSGLANGPLTATRIADLDHSLSKLVWTVRHQGKYDAQKNRLALEQLALAFGRTELALSGVVDSLGPHARFDLRAKGANFELAEIMSWVAAADANALHGLSGRGRLAFDLGLRGAMGAPPAVTGVLTVQNGAFRYPGAPVGVEAVTFAANFTPDRMTITDLRASVSGQPVRAQLRAWHFVDPQLEFAVQGNLDLAAVAPLLAKQGGRVTGRAVVDVRGGGRAKDPGALALDGRAQLQDVSVEQPGLPKKIEGINGLVRFSPQQAQVQHLTARAGLSSYTLDATVTRPLALLATPGKVEPAGVTFDFRSPYLDLAELLPVTPGAPYLPNARGHGNVEITRLKHGKLDVADVKAAVQLQPAALETNAFSLQGYGGTVKGSARFDLHDTAKPVFAIKAQVEKVQADALLSTWTAAKGLVSGALSTTLDFSGQGLGVAELKRTLTLVGLASMSEGQLGPGPTFDAIAQFVKVPQLKQVRFKALELPLRIERGKVLTDRVKFTGPNGDWQLAGAIGFDGALDYAVSITLPPEVAAALNAKSALAAGAFSDDQGRVLLDLRVTGPARAPRISWDSRAMGDRLAGRASAALAEQRAKIEADVKAAAQQALLDALSGKRDSTGARPSSLDPDSLKKAAKDLLDSFFKPKPKPPVTTPPATTPPITPPPAARDTAVVTPVSPADTIPH